MIWFFAYGHERGQERFRLQLFWLLWCLPSFLSGRSWIGLFSSSHRSEQVYTSEVWFTALLPQALLFSPCHCTESSGFSPDLLPCERALRQTAWLLQLVSICTEAAESGIPPEWSRCCCGTRVVTKANPASLSLQKRVLCAHLWAHFLCLQPSPFLNSSIHKHPHVAVRLPWGRCGSSVTQLGRVSRPRLWSPSRCSPFRGVSASAGRARGAQHGQA